MGLKKDERGDLIFIEQNLAHGLLFQGHYASSDEEWRNFLETGDDQV